MGYIPQKSLDRLKNYKYSGVDKLGLDMASILSKYALNPFWNWLVTLWPKTVAPNTITLAGLTMVFFNFATMIYYDPAYLTVGKGATGPPNWIYFTWGAGLFIYQSFDAIDGKQARRTGMAGPLGEMFDHGCDAMNTTLEVILAAHALNLGRSWWTVASQIATLANFYLTTWEEYHTGTLYLGAFSGPVEGILIICVIYLVTGVYGPTFWDTGVLTFTRLDQIPAIAELKLPNPGLNEAFMMFGAVGLLSNIVTSYGNVYRATSSSKSKMKPLLFLLPFYISAGIQILWLSAPTPKDSSIINSSLFVPFLCAWGLQFAHQVGRMILAHVTQGRFPFFDAMWIWSAAAAIDANAPWLLGRDPIIQSSAKGQIILVYVTLVLSLIHYAVFCTRVINDITNHLGIACFTVRKKNADGDWEDASVVDAKKQQ